LALLLIEFVLASHYIALVKAGEEFQLRTFAFGLDKSGDLTDDQFGRAMRVQLEALVLIEQQFDLLKRLGEPKQPEGKTANPAR